MNLYLLRHAEAQDASSTGRDADRALTAKGREVMKTVGAAFALVADPEEIFHSPYRRARETAELVGAALPKAKLIEVPWLTPESDPRIAFDEIRGRHGDLLWVGHQPHLGRALGYAVTGSDEIEIPMRKASVARVSFSGSRASAPGSLKWLISPGLAQHMR